MKRLFDRPCRRRQEMARGTAGKGMREPHDGAAPVSRAAGGLARALSRLSAGRCDTRAEPGRRGWADPAVRRRAGRMGRTPGPPPLLRASPDAAPAAWFRFPLWRQVRVRRRMRWRTSAILPGQGPDTLGRTPSSRMVGFPGKPQAFRWSDSACDPGRNAAGSASSTDPRTPASVLARSCRTRRYAPTPPRRFRTR